MGDPTSGGYWGAAVSAALSLFAPGGGGSGSSGDIGVGGPYNRPGGARAVASAGGAVISFQPPPRTVLDARVSLNTTARVDAAHQTVRFVTSWATTDAQVDALLAVLAQVLD